jgi:hypothetical protein
MGYNIAGKHVSTKENSGPRVSVSSQNKKITAVSSLTKVIQVH